MEWNHKVPMHLYENKNSREWLSSDHISFNENQKGYGHWP